MSSRTEKVIYNSPEDWDSWSNRFISKAKHLDLWIYIDDSKQGRPRPWPEAPERPNFRTYTYKETDTQRKARLKSANEAIEALRNRLGINENTSNENELTAGNHDEDSEPGANTPQTLRGIENHVPYTITSLPNLVPKHITDLTENAEKQYNEDVKVYLEEKRDYETLQDNRKELATWVLETVKDSIVENKLRHDRTITEWYQILRKNSALFIEESRGST